MGFLKDRQIGWLAGMIDGEGCIVLSYHKKQHRVNLSVRVVNTHLQTIERVKLFAGCGSIYKEKPIKSNHKPGMRWEAHGKEAMFVLNIVKDDVVTKRLQLLLALDFANKFLQNSLNRLTSTEKDEAFSYYIEMKMLNCRGI